MTEAGLIAAWEQEEQHAFAGWDFAHLRGRMLEEQPPWDYMARAADLARASRALLDMDTGGGERLLALRSAWPASVTATEHYAPNLALARARLEPLGVRVVDTDCSEGARLPFADAGFDLVLNRHGAFDPAEVARILSPGGVFLTQQVHGLFADDLLAAFDVAPANPDHEPGRCVEGLRKAGLAVASVDDWAGTLEFSDIGAVVYYFRAIPWMVPGFSVATHRDALIRLQHLLQETGSLRFTARLFLIETVR